MIRKEYYRLLKLSYEVDSNEPLPLSWKQRLNIQQNLNSFGPDKIPTVFSHLLLFYVRRTGIIADHSGRVV
jgi:hypothetical protein